MPSEEDLVLATSLAKKLANRDRESERLGFPGEDNDKVYVSEFSEQERDIYLGDVAELSREFARALRIHEWYGLPFPCIKSPMLPHAIPLSIGIEDSLLFDAPRFQIRLHDEWAFRIDRYLKYRSTTSDVIIESSSTEQVRELFFRGMQRFLAVRFSARQSNISARPGFLFEVETDTSGLIVVYGGASYLKARPFQAPTTPVRQWIQPGGWIFGAATSSPVPRWDPAMLQYDVPPDNKAKIKI